MNEDIVGSNRVRKNVKIPFRLRCKVGPRVNQKTCLLSNRS